MSDLWPALPLNEWKDTYATLHMWTQIVGKVRLKKTPPWNHWWNVTLYVSTRGLTTSKIPSENGSFEIEFDFIEHKLLIHISNGQTKVLELKPRSVADFYMELMATLKVSGIDVKIRAIPDEVADPIPFAKDEIHKSYDPEYANRLFRILLQIDKVFKEFQSKFIGKSSPVHFFWGSFDLAVTRFSGKRAPKREGADTLTREAYSHEVISAGWWPGGGVVQAPAFYCYAAPAPGGLDQARVRPASAYYNKEMGEFLLLYDEVREARSPENVIHEFVQSTYEAGANLAGWDRSSLER
ncbi:MAG: hypothetical protein C5B54_01845 [Acidobacteria bacterium]|nr:MAG: hypothetical protein C5B54_01845 [Acidobacteriota bacterium]